MIRVQFTVLGTPQPGGSKRGLPIRRGGQLTGRVAVVDANPKASGWRSEVRGEAQCAVTGQGLLVGALGMRLVFTVTRPKGHYGSGRNSDAIKPSAPEFPITRPDVDKLSRLVLDALSGVVYGDDAQIVVKDVRKLYGPRPGVSVDVWEIEPTGVVQAVRSAA